MKPYRRWRAFAAIVLAASVRLPAVARAQAPAYLAQWGTYGNGDGQFVAPVGVAVDVSGNVYVADGNYRVQKFSSGGTYIAQWGTPGGGNGQFVSPFGVAGDVSGDVFVSEYNIFGRIHRFNRE